MKDIEKLQFLIREILQEDKSEIAAIAKNYAQEPKVYQARYYGRELKNKWAKEADIQSFNKAFSRL